MRFRSSSRGMVGRFAVANVVGAQTLQLQNDVTYMEDMLWIGCKGKVRCHDNYMRCKERLFASGASRQCINHSLYCTVVKLTGPWFAKICQCEWPKIHVVQYK
jgi:hypothetical protein